jgi:tRNA threonylcarbamoyladenosine biosynthesis protein TsaE
MAILISHSPEETIALGEQWGRQAQPGWVIGLTGELGAGKTQLVKGIARGLDITARVLSPTFNLVHEYGGGRLSLVHIDLYRLETPSQIIGAGLEKYFYQPPGVTVIEWVERWFDPVHSPMFKVQCLFARYRRVQIETIGETDRRITYEDPGA